ncbi:hypothetical protein NFI96_030961, partial [Prochilodus magdalenae]
QQPQNQPGDHQYITDTFQYIKTVKNFCDGEGEWISKRELEIEDMRETKSRTDPMLSCFKRKKTKNKEEVLEEVLKNTLEGLEDLQHFLDAVEKLAVTSPVVFMGEGFPLKEMNTEAVQSAILAAKRVSPVLVQFKRDHRAFFKPELDNVDLLVHQLHKYICVTKWLCREMRMDESFRLPFLVDAQEFIKTYNTCHPEMSLSLSGVEKNRVGLDRTKDTYSALTIIGSLIGIVGAILSFRGLFLYPAYLSLTLARWGGMLGLISGAVSLVTGAAEFVVNKCCVKQAKQNISNFTKNMQKLIDCLEKAASSQRPAPHVDEANMELGVLKVMSYGRTISKGFDAIMDGAAVLEPLDFTKLTTYVLIAGNTPSFLADMVFFSRELWSICKRKKTKVSKLLQSRTALWRSEMEALKRINDCLSKDDGRLLGSQWEFIPPSGSQDREESGRLSSMSPQGWWFESSCT